MGKVLIVDDDSLIVAALKLQFEELGHQTFSASDAYQAMTVATREKPDLITIDFQMPAGNGLVVHQRLRSNAFLERTPIIFISGVSRIALGPEVGPDPFVRFLQKPVDPEELKRLMSELLGGGKPPAASAKKPGDDSLGGDILDLKLDD